MAISLVVAANFAFAKLRPQTKEEIKVVEKVVEVEKPLECMEKKKIFLHLQKKSEKRKWGIRPQT